MTPLLYSTVSRLRNRISVIRYRLYRCRKFPRLREWQIEFNHSSLFMSLFVTDDPLMADGEQREACKVTNPWPPATC